MEVRRTKTRAWPEGTIRAFGLVSILLGLEGTAFQAHALLSFARHPLNIRPFESAAFYTEAIVNLMLVLGTIVAGVFLWKRGRSGRIISNVVFASEIVFFLGSAWVLLPLMMYGGKAKAIGLTIASVWGIAGLGTVLQDITLYPLIALIVINLAYRRLNRDAMTQSSRPT